MVRVFDAPIITNDQSLDRLLSSPLPVLILFWDGTGLPESVNQTLIRLADQEAGELIIAKVNASENPKAAQRFNVPSALQARRAPNRARLHTPQPLLVVGVKGGQELIRRENPAEGEIEQAVQFLLGRAPRPEEPAPKATSPGGRVSAGAESRPLPVTDATFEELVLKSPLPVVVDFWAPWCGPCHMIAPTLDRLARDYAGRLRIAKVNVDQNPHYAGTYGIQGIPTLLMVRDGTVVDRVVGVVPEPHLRAKVEHMLAHS